MSPGPPPLVPCADGRLVVTEHETEISFFVMADYEAFRADPVEKW